MFCIFSSEVRLVRLKLKNDTTAASNVYRLLRFLDILNDGKQVLTEVRKRNTDPPSLAELSNNNWFAGRHDISFLVITPGKA